MAPNSKNDEGYQFTRRKSTWKTNFAHIGGFLYFGDHFGFKMAAIVNQNGRHMVQHVLLLVNIHFHWNLFIFEFLTIYFYFISFILAAILKIWKTKSTTLSDDLILCQVSKGSAVRFPFSIFCTLVTMATATILNFSTPPKAATHYGGYSYKVSWSLMKGIQTFFKSPFFVSMASAAKFVQPIPIILAYLVPLDVDVVPIKFYQFLFGE